MSESQKKRQKSLFAQNISKRRKLMGLSQDEFAARIGLHKNAIVKLENDQSGGTLKTRELLAGFFNCSVEELFLDPDAVKKEVFDFADPLKAEDYANLIVRFEQAPQPIRLKTFEELKNLGAKSLVPDEVFLLAPYIKKWETILHLLRQQAEEHEAFQSRLGSSGKIK